MNEFTDAEIEEMSAEAGLTADEFKSALQQSHPDVPEEDLNTVSREGVSAHLSTQHLPLRPREAVREVLDRIEHALRVKGRTLAGGTAAEVFDQTHGVMYQILAERAEGNSSRVTVMLDPEAARTRTMMSGSGAITNAIVGTVLVGLFAFPPLITAFTAAIVGGSFMFAHKTRARAIDGLARGRAIVAAALLGADETLALPPAI